MGKPLIAVVGIVASLCYVGRVFCAEDASNGFGSELNWRSPKELKVKLSVALHVGTGFT